MSELDPWIPAFRVLALVAAAIGGGWVAYRLLFRTLAEIARRAPGTLSDDLVANLRPGARILLPVVALRLGSHALTGVPAELLAPLQQTLTILAIVGSAWLAIGVVSQIAAHVRGSHRVDIADNLDARRVHTQAEVLERSVEILIIIVAIGLALLTFPAVRQLGAGLLASAGAVGLVFGLAARPVLENLIAGVQVALTQPIRLDDVVVVEGEWGRIEEITTTYVVVRIWDERRLIVPFSTFLQKPFQNWTRESADILGTVTLYADYTVPVDDIRAALDRIVRDAPEWDGRVCNLQVTGASERTVELRALVSASDSGRGWDLRVRVREQLLAHLQEHHPGALPQTRVTLSREATGSAGLQGPA